MLSRQALLRSARAAAPSRAIASQARFYAAPAASESVKPPVALFGLDGTYASALVRHGADPLRQTKEEPPRVAQLGIPSSRIAIDACRGESGG